MSVVPEDIRMAAWNAAGHIYDPSNKSHSYASDIIAAAILAERDRCAFQLEEKARLMRGSPTGDMMARIFEAEAIAMRNAHTLVRTPSTPPEGREQNT